MFNGVGLRTPRGSGTNGYVQRSLATLPLNKFVKNIDQAPILTRPRMQADPSILEHERRRQVEVKLMQLRIRLEDEMSPEDIEKEVAKQRLVLEAQLESQPLIKPHSHQNESSTHTMAATKALEVDKMKKALGLEQPRARKSNGKGRFIEDENDYKDNARKREDFKRSTSRENRGRRRESAGALRLRPRTRSRSVSQLDSRSSSSASASEYSVSPSKSRSRSYSSRAATKTSKKRGRRSRSRSKSLSSAASSYSYSSYSASSASRSRSRSRSYSASSSSASQSSSSSRSPPPSSRHRHNLSSRRRDTSPDDEKRSRRRINSRQRRSYSSSPSPSPVRGSKRSVRKNGKVGHSSPEKSDHSHSSSKSLSPYSRRIKMTREKELARRLNGKQKSRPKLRSRSRSRSRSSSDMSRSSG